MRGFGRPDRRLWSAVASLAANAAEEIVVPAG
jgi:hypothetical protein